MHLAFAVVATSVKRRRKIRNVNDGIKHRQILLKCCSAKMKRLY